ncbi:hypothetical protein G0U57_001204, partial [Chelydra serpentina]
PEGASAEGWDQRHTRHQNHLAPEEQPCGWLETNPHSEQLRPQEPRLGQAPARPGGSNSIPAPSGESAGSACELRGESAGGTCELRGEGAADPSGESAG